MTTSVLRYIIMFFVLVFVQVLLLNNIEYSGYINPFLYIYFLMALPFRTPRWAMLVIGFVLGILIDAFSDAAGIHAAASTFLGYMRYHILNLLKPREGYEATRSPAIRDMSFSWYLIYAALMVLLHHTFFFFIEVFRLSDFFAIFTKILLSSLFTFLLVLLVQLLFTRQRDAE